MSRLPLLGLLAPGFMLALAGCAQLPKSTLSLQEIEKFHVADVDVEFDPSAEINWGDAEREYVTSKGLVDPGGPTSLGEADPAAEKKREAYRSALTSPEAKSFTNDKIKHSFKTAFSKVLNDKMKGARQGRVKVVLKGLHIASAGQRVFVGGQHVGVADVSFVDETGKTLTGVPNLAGVGPAMNGWLGVLIDQAGDEPINRVSYGMAGNFRNWLLAGGA
jgi:hypothetical protein